MFSDVVTAFRLLHMDNNRFPFEYKKIKIGK
jgi:hypothetical protein